MQTSTDQLCVVICIRMHVICISWVFGISMVKFVWITCVLHNGDIGTHSMLCRDRFLCVHKPTFKSNILCIQQQHKMKLDQANYSMETIKWLKTLQLAQRSHIFMIYCHNFQVKYFVFSPWTISILYIYLACEWDFGQNITTETDWIISKWAKLYFLTFL